MLIEGSGPNELSICDAAAIPTVLGVNGLPKGQCMSLAASNYTAASDRPALDYRLRRPARPQRAAKPARDARRGPHQPPADVEPRDGTRGAQGVCSADAAPGRAPRGTAGEAEGEEG